MGEFIGAKASLCALETFLLERCVRREQSASDARDKDVLKL